MMPPTQRSSGDLAADRRYGYAVDLLAAGDAVAAADLLEQMLELVPQWPVGWFTLGTAREKTGQLSAAIAAFTHAAELDADDTLGAQLHLVRLGARPTPDQPPSAYVRGLFDDYADRFDRALVEGLAYRAPQLIASRLVAPAGPGRYFANALDLGCGTGLMAEALSGRVNAWTGVDLSSRMIAAAHMKELYAALEVGDIVAAMRARADATFDLVTAADVFCYLGDLSPAIDEAARVLAPGGVLAFTVEQSTHDAANFSLGEALRFHHHGDYVKALLGRAGLIIDRFDAETLRNDRGLPIGGLVVIAFQPRIA